MDVDLMRSSPLASASDRLLSLFLHEKLLVPL
jgi:hypothetical protein